MFQIDLCYGYYTFVSVHKGYYYASGQKRPEQLLLEETELWLSACSEQCTGLHILELVYGPDLTLLDPAAHAH